MVSVSVTDLPFFYSLQFQILHLRDDDDDDGGGANGGMHSGEFIEKKR